MDKQLTFAVKVWGFATLAGSLLTCFALACITVDPGIFIISLYLIFFAITRGIPSLILFFIVVKLLSKTKWLLRYQLWVMALFGAICCAANVIGFVYRKQMDEMIIHDVLLISAYSLTVILGVYLFRKTLYNSETLTEQKEDAPLPIQ